MAWSSVRARPCQSGSPFVKSGWPAAMDAGKAGADHDAAQQTHFVPMVRTLDRFQDARQRGRSWRRMRRAAAEGLDQSASHCAATVARNCRWAPPARHADHHRRHHLAQGGDGSRVARASATQFVWPCSAAARVVVLTHAMVMNLRFPVGGARHDTGPYGAWYRRTRSARGDPASPPSGPMPSMKRTAPAASNNGAPAGARCWTWNTGAPCFSRQSPQQRIRQPPSRIARKRQAAVGVFALVVDQGSAALAPVQDGRRGNRKRWEAFAVGFVLRSFRVFLHRVADTHP